MPECIGFPEGQANTLYFLSELNCEGPFLLFLVFIPITLPGIYDPLGFSPITEVGCEC